jgi:gluconokinase
MNCAPQHLVVMGAAGSGKTTIGRALAARLGYELADADDFHAESSVAKMARGEPLTDDDRRPWLQTLARWIASRDAGGRSSVLACSALKRRYRDELRAAAPRRVSFVFLAVPSHALRERLRERTEHFARSDLLDSQLATLEPLEADEPGICVDGAMSSAAIVERVLDYLASRPAKT